MARTSLPDDPPNLDAVNLARALSRLAPKITQDPSSRLQHSSIERAKTAANLEYARTLLLRREHATSQLKAPAKKKQQQAILSQQRALLKKLTERLAEIGHLASDENDVEQWSEEGEDILFQLAPPSSRATDSIAISHPPRSPSADSNVAATDDVPKLSSPAGSADVPSQRIPSPTSTLRARNPREALLGAAAMTTSSDLQTPTNPPSSSPPEDVLSKETATALASADSEQTQLTTAMLTLAAALKQSAQTFAADLDADKGTVRVTETALDKNKEGMERTSGGMARLRKMSEGKWWVTRVGMMILIPVLWVVLLLEVFVMPKVLRFP